MWKNELFLISLLLIFDYDNYWPIISETPVYYSILLLFDKTNHDQQIPASITRFLWSLRRSFHSEYSILHLEIQRASVFLQQSPALNRKLHKSQSVLLGVELFQWDRWRFSFYFEMFDALSRCRFFARLPEIIPIVTEKAVNCGKRQTLTGPTVSRPISVLKLIFAKFSL